MMLPPAVMMVVMVMMIAIIVVMCRGGRRREPADEQAQPHGTANQKPLHNILPCLPCYRFEAARISLFRSADKAALGSGAARAEARSCYGRSPNALFEPGSAPSARFQPCGYLRLHTCREDAEPRSFQLRVALQLIPRFPAGNLGREIYHGRCRRTARRAGRPV